MNVRPLPLRDVSIIMPVCAWPDPNDPAGDPHPHLLAALDSIVAGAKAYSIVAGAKAPSPADVELLIGLDGRCRRVQDAIYDWRAANPTFPVRGYLCEKAPVNTWGNRQRNIILNSGEVCGRMIVWQDQDDEFFPGALSRIVQIVDKANGHPVIFKMQVCADRNGSAPFVLWKTKGLVERGQIGGHMLVVPNEPSLIGRWEPEESYSADFDFIKSTLDKFAAIGREAYWSEEFISNLRPSAMEQP